MKAKLISLSKLPLYWHLIILFIGSLNFSSVLLLDNGQTVIRLIKEIRSEIGNLEGDLRVENGVLLGNAQVIRTETPQFALYILSEIASKNGNYIFLGEANGNLFFNGETVNFTYEEEMSSSDIGAYILVTLFAGLKVGLIFSLIQGLLFSTLLFFMLVVIILYFTRRMFSFLKIFKGSTLPFVLGSLGALGFYFWGGGGVISSYLFGIGSVGVFIALSFYEELKKVVTINWLGIEK